MSAFVVSNDTIDALVTALPTSPKMAAYERTKMGRVLLAENLRSVATRYNDTLMPMEAVAQYQWKAKQLPAITVLKLCDCYDYQACETDDYQTTEACKLVQQIRKGLIRTLPGYEQAPWGL